MEIQKAEQFIKDKLIAKQTSEKRKRFTQIVDYSEMAQIMVEYSKSVNPRLIDKVTVENVDLALRMIGITCDHKTIDNIIDLVELIEDKGDDTSIKDICRLQSEWQ